MFTTTNLAPTSPDLSPAPPRNFATSAAAAANANLKIVVGLSSFGVSSAAGTRSDNPSDEHEQYRRPTSLEKPLNGGVDLMTSLIDMDFVYLYCSGRIGKVHRLLDQTASSRCLLRSDTASTLLGPAQVVVVSSSASSSSVGGDTAGSAPTLADADADGHPSPFFDAIDGYYSLAFVGNMDSSKNKTEGLVRVVSHMTYRCLSLLNAPVCCLSESASILNPTSSDITQHTYYIHYVF